MTLRTVSLAAVLIAALLAGCMDDAGPTELPKIPPPTMDVELDDPPRGAPKVTLLHSDPWGLVPLDVNFGLVLERVENRTVEWRMDLDGDGDADAWGNRTDDDDFTEAERYKVAGTTDVEVLVFWDGHELLHETVTVRAFNATQYEASIDAHSETVSCSEAQEWEDEDQVSRVGDNGGNHTVEFPIDKTTRGSDYIVDWQIETGFHEGWIFFTRTEGDILESETLHSPDGGGIHIEGTVPDRTDWVVLHLCGSASEFSVRYVA